MLSTSEKAIYNFGDYRLVVSARGLDTLRALYRRGSDQPAALKDLALKLLEYLVTHPGDPLHRDQIINAVWTEDHENPNVVDQQIKLLRIALDDTSKNHRYIESVSGLGYKFKMSVKMVAAKDAQTIQSPRGRLSLEDAQAFEEFFGPDTTSNEPRLPHGAIVVQADPIDHLVEAISKEARAEIRNIPGNRSYKARMWANYHDLKGAEYIVQFFDNLGLRPPQIHLSVHNSVEDRQLPAHSALLVAMGLGFTDRSKRAFDVCEAWMRVSRTTKAGDAVALHESLAFRHSTPGAGTPSDFIPATDFPKFWARLPLGWKAETYLDRWAAGLDIDNTKEPVQDYAVILRHTEMIGRRKQVRFVLGGFTERGTAVAGKYLTLHWKNLWRKYVQQKPDEGDFLTLIEGPSDIYLYSGWEEDESFAVTPTDVHECGIRECPWFERVEARMKSA